MSAIAKEPVEADRVAVATPSMATVARGLSWTAIGGIVGQGSWYASLLVLASLVPTRAFGAVAVGSVIVAITTLLMDSGTGGAIVVTPEVTASQLRRSVIRTGAAGLALGGLAAALAGPIMKLFARGADPNVVRAMVLAVVLASFSIVPMALLKKTLHFKRQTLVLIAAAILASAAAIVAGALGAGVWALVIRIVLYQGFVTGLSWIAVIGLLPRGRGSDAETHAPRRAAAPAFMVLALAGFAAQTLDNLIVGHFTNVGQLGLYAMAFSLGLAPTMQISWQLGGVLFPAIAATRDPAEVARRTLKAMRLTALLLLPLLPPAIIVAPSAIPAVMGHKWSGMVAPFQVLIVVGVVQGILNILAESVAAGGGVTTRARIDAAWAALTICALVAGTQLDGIMGAAYAHLAMLACLVGAYLRWAAPSIRLSTGQIVSAVGGVAMAVCAQGAVTLAILLGAQGLGASRALSALSAALLGLVALVLAMPRTSPGVASEARSVIRAAGGRRRT